MWKAVRWECPLNAVQWVLEKDPSFAQLRFTVAQQRSEVRSCSRTTVAQTWYSLGKGCNTHRAVQEPALPRDTARSWLPPEHRLCPAQHWAPEGAAGCPAWSTCWSGFLLVFWEMWCVACKVRRVGSLWLQLLGLDTNFWRMLDRLSL